MLFLFLLACFQGPSKHCYPYLSDTCKDKTCEICCQSNEQCWVACSDGWKMELPSVPTQDDYMKTVCHCRGDYCED